MGRSNRPSHTFALNDTIARSACSRDVGKVLLTFAWRLKGVELTTDAVEDFSNIIIEARAAARNSKNGNELADALPVLAGDGLGKASKPKTT